MNALKRILVGLLGLAVVLVGALLLWALAEPYFLDEEEQVAVVPGLPAAWEGQRFALLADWQVGMWLANIPTIRRAVDRLAEERPAFVLIAGDFVYHTAKGDAEEVENAARLVRPLTEAGVPVYAVLGNHDYGMKHPDGTPDAQLARRVTAALERAGVRVLENEAAALRPAGISNGRLSSASEGAFSEQAPAEQALAEQTLYLVGVGPSWPGRAAPEEALAQVPAGAPRVALMHNPNAFEAFPAGAAPVAVAGHTHGGQVRLPFTPEWGWMAYFKDDAVHTDGWIPEGYGRGANRLYVSRGIGFSLAPLRLNAQPELTRFTLRAP